MTARGTLVIALVLLFWVWLAAWATHAQTADRACTAADVSRFEQMFGGRGSYHSDPRFQITIHYLGTSVSNGVCYVAIRPAS